MANTMTCNVIYVDTTAAFSGPARISGFKYIGASSGTAVVTDTTSGYNLWQESGTSNQHVDDVEIYCPKGFTVTVANSAKVYVYLEG